ncbi:unnamed protein product [Penicillium glandicola]
MLGLKHFFDHDQELATVNSIPISGSEVINGPVSLIALCQSKTNTHWTLNLLLQFPDDILRSHPSRTFQFMGLQTDKAWGHSPGKWNGR